MERGGLGRAAGLAGRGVALGLGRVTTVMSCTGFSYPPQLRLAGRTCTLCKLGRSLVQRVHYMYQRFLMQQLQQTDTAAAHAPSTRQSSHQFVCAPFVFLAFCLCMCASMMP